MVLQCRDPFTPPSTPGAFPFFPTPDKDSPPVAGLSHSWSRHECRASRAPVVEKKNPISKEDQEAIDALVDKTKDIFAALMLDIITNLASKNPASEEQWSSIQKKLRLIFVNEDQLRRKISEIMVYSNVTRSLDTPYFTHLVKMSRIRLSMVAWTVVNVPAPLGIVENRLNQTMAKAVTEAGKNLARFTAVEDALQDPQEEFVRAFKIAAYDFMVAKEGELPDSVKKIQGALARAENRLQRPPVELSSALPQRSLGSVEGNRLHLRLHGLFLKKS